VVGRKFVYVSASPCTGGKYCAARGEEARRRCRAATGVEGMRKLGRFRKGGTEGERKSTGGSLFTKEKKKKYRHSALVDRGGKLEADNCSRIFL